MDCLTSGQRKTNASPCWASDSSAEPPTTKHPPVGLGLCFPQSLYVCLLALVTNNNSQCIRAFCHPIDDLLGFTLCTRHVYDSDGRPIFRPHRATENSYNHPAHTGRLFFRP